MLFPGPRLWRDAGRTLVIWASLLPVAVIGAAGPDLAGTLPEDYLPGLRPVLEAARQRSPRVIASEIEIALNEARVFASEAPRLPSLHAYLDFAGSQTAVSGDQSIRNRDQGFFYRVTLNQALFHWGALKHQSAIGAINVAIAERNHAEAHRLLALNLRQWYLALIARKAALGQARHAHEAATANLAVEREKLSRGLVARNPVVRRELALREAGLHLTRMEAEFAADRRRLARVAGIGELTEDELPAAIPRPAYSADLAALVVRGLMQAGTGSLFEAQVIELRTREASLRHEIARVRLLPKFFASAGSSLENATTATANTVTQQGVTRQTLSVGAQWDIFDGFAARGARREALASRREQESRLENFTEETFERAQLLAQQLAIDAEGIEISELQYGLASDGLRQLSSEFELGSVSRAAVIGAESEVRVSEANRVGAYAALLTRWSELVSLAGMDPLLNHVPAARHARN